MLEGLCKQFFIWLLVFSVKFSYVSINIKIFYYIMYYIFKGKLVVLLDIGDLYVMVVLRFNIGICLFSCFFGVRQYFIELICNELYIFIYLVSKMFFSYIFL